MILFEAFVTWFVYILQCSDASYYTGHTSDLDFRLNYHNSGRGSVYTSKRSPCTLIYSEEHPTKESAVKREQQLKKWSRPKKQALIDGNISELKRHSKSFTHLRNI